MPEGAELRPTSCRPESAELEMLENACTSIALSQQPLGAIIIVLQRKKWMGQLSK